MTVLRHGLNCRHAGMAKSSDPEENERVGCTCADQHTGGTDTTDKAVLRSAILTLERAANHLESEAQRIRDQIAIYRSHVQ